MFNDLKFSDSADYSEDMMGGCPRISMLMLSHNQLSELSADRFLRLFGQLNNIEDLYMGYSGVSQAMFTKGKTINNTIYITLLNMECQPSLFSSKNHPLHINTPREGVHSHFSIDIS
jgi:hypothetical protein